METTRIHVHDDAAAWKLAAEILESLQGLSIAEAEYVLREAGTMLRASVVINTEVVAAVKQQFAVASASAD